MPAGQDTQLIGIREPLSYMPTMSVMADVLAPYACWPGYPVNRD